MGAAIFRKDVPYSVPWKAAASLFNAASSENTDEQQAAEDALREAMSSPSQVQCTLQSKFVLDS